MSRPGTGNIWTVEGDEALEKQSGEDVESLGPGGEGGLSEEDTKILLEKEFDDLDMGRSPHGEFLVKFEELVFRMVTAGMQSATDESYLCRKYLFKITKQKQAVL